MGQPTDWGRTEAEAARTLPDVECQDTPPCSKRGFAHRNAHRFISGMIAAPNGDRYRRMELRCRVCGVVSHGRAYYSFAGQPASLI